LIEDESLRKESLKLIQELRGAARVDYSFVPAKSDKQFKRALESNAAHIVKLERTGNGGLVASIRNLRSREAIVCAVEQVITQLQRAD
jgi:histidyl-tRNA synthetase